MRRANLGLAAGFLAILVLAFAVLVAALLRGADPAPQWEHHCEYVDDFNTYRCEWRTD